MVFSLVYSFRQDTSSEKVFASRKSFELWDKRWRWCCAQKRQLLTDLGCMLQVFISDLVRGRHLRGKCRSIKGIIIEVIQQKACIINNQCQTNLCQSLHVTHNIWNILKFSCWGMIGPVVSRNVLELFFGLNHEVYQCFCIFFWSVCHAWITQWK